jgi:hypothetical protein
MGRVSRSFYQWSLWLYPEPFRREFGGEMLALWEECKAAHGAWRLLADVVVSAAKTDSLLVDSRARGRASSLGDSLFPDVGGRRFRCRSSADLLFGGNLKARQSPAVARSEATGATGDVFGPEFDRHRVELQTHEDYIHLYSSRPPRFEPGSRFEYSNYGFVILGAVIDRVSGQNYFDYVRNRVYIPAGMAQEVLDPGNQPVRNASLGYSKQGGTTWRTDRGSPPFRGTAAGSGYTTVGDAVLRERSPEQQIAGL